MTGRARDRRGGEDGHPAQARAGQEQRADHDRHEHEGRAQVRLDHDQHERRSRQKARADRSCQTPS